MTTIGEWLASIGMERYAEVFDENAVDRDVLPHLDHSLLKEIGVRAVGDRVRILEAIKADTDASDSRGAPSVCSAVPGQSLSGGAERRQITVLFCDLAGSTELARRLDPEQLRELVGEYHKTARAAIDRYDGYVAQYLGDGVLAYFGYPQAHEEDAERAIFAALAIVQGITELDLRAANETREPLRARIGIATGPVVVGQLIGEEAVQERAAIGETPNIASRLQEIAPPNAIVIGPETHLLAQERFDYKDLGGQTLKGFAEPIHAWQVLGERAFDTRFDLRNSAGTASLVGRTEELELILHRWEQVEDGEGQTVLLSGEPGIGKSRIVRELENRISGNDCTFLRYQPSPYHLNTALWPFIDQLQRAARIETGDTVSHKLQKLEALLSRYTENTDEAVAYIAQVLSIDVGERYNVPRLTGQELKNRILELFLEQLVQLSANKPVVVTFEDAHWSDPTSRELLNRIIQSISALPVLLVITFRPDFEPPWKAFSHVTSLALNRLSKREVAEFVKYLTGNKSFPDEVIVEIFARTDGIPLFVEELARYVLESEALIEQSGSYILAKPLSKLGIPTTLKDSLMARLDRLATAREVAQTAAVIGREFSYSLLSEICPKPKCELENALGKLAEAELVFRRGEPPNCSYTFKHALVRDAAYESLLLSKRTAIHGRVAAVLERRHVENLDEVCETIAYHYRRAEQPGNAVGYLIQAAAKSAKRHSHWEAIEALSEALEQLGRLESGSAYQAATIRLRLAQSHYFAGNFQKSVAILGDQQNQDGAMSDPTLAADWFFWLAHMSVRLGQPEAAQRAAKRAVQEGSKTGATGAVGKAYGVLVFHAHLYDDADALKRSLNYAKQSKSALKQAGESYWRGMTDFYLGMVQILAADFGPALESSDRAYRIGAMISDKRLQAYGRFLRGWVLATRGDTDAAEQVCQEAIDLAPDATSKAYASCFLGYAYLEAGKAGLARPLLNQAVADFVAFQFRPFEGWFRALLAESQREEDETDHAFTFAQDGLDITAEARYAWGQGWAQRVLGRLAAQQDDADRAEVWLRTALHTFERISARNEIARTLSDLAETQSMQRLLDDANDTRQRAKSLYREIGLDRTIVE